MRGAAFFKANDYVLYDDDGDVRIVVTADGSSTVLFRSSAAAVGSFGGTPWTNWSYTFEDSGT
ncbi:MAG TPA: hypothetical protein VGV57_13470 [Thermoleophilaceae bacterium]|nr:hypothetical protein [Thermoleophilaceae bacterium]